MMDYMDHLDAKEDIATVHHGGTATSLDFAKIFTPDGRTMQRPSMHIRQ